MSRMNRWLVDTTQIAFWLAVAAWLCLAALLASWVLDDTPPFKMNSYTVYNAPPGGTMLISMNVERDSKRKCAVSFSRRLLDHNGVSHTVGSQQDITARGLEQIDKATPGRYNAAIFVPLSAAIGTGTYTVDLQYSCNPFQRISPIEVTLSVPIEVLTP